MTWSDRPVGRRGMLTGGAAALLLAVAGCSGSSSGAGPSSSGSSAPTATGADSASAGPLVPNGTPTTIVDHLQVPWSLVFVGSSALFSERDSDRILELDGGTARVVGTVEGVRRDAGEGGLLGLAVHAGRLFVYYSAASDNRVVSYALTGSAGGYGLGARSTVLTGIPTFAIHNGGRIAVGPDGMLYITTGDAGTSSRAQSLTSLGGKILRVTPTGAVPTGNPFPNSPIWTYGHRNVQGLGWTSDGTMFASEFGLNTWDELNIIKPGRNYGWPTVEGRSDDRRFVNPVQQWHPDVASPSGLAIIDDSILIANLRGERLRVVPASDPGTSKDYFTGVYGRLRAAVAAPDGSLWLLTNNTDGRGTPKPGDDRILRVPLTHG